MNKPHNMSSTGPWLTVRAERFAENPLIRPEMLAGTDSENINGPCLLRVPPWVARPLAKYYLYFAHHGGAYIRLATADDLHGPWTIRPGGVLHKSALAMDVHHVASPEILVDDRARQIRMYFHVAARDKAQLTFAGPHRDAGWSGQTTHVALSGDGLTFEPQTPVLAPFYLRVFRRGGSVYGVAKPGNGMVLCRSRDGLTTFERGPEFLGRTRHVALWPEGDALWIFFSQIGDAPERILLTRLEMAGDWTRWPDSLREPVEVLAPETPYEGAGFANAPSVPSAGVNVRQVRDPFVHVEGGRMTLFYSVAGEAGIAAADLTFDPPAAGPRLA